MAEGPSSRPLYNLLLLQFKQRARSPSSGGPRGPGWAVQPDAFVYYGSTRRAGRRPGLRGGHREPRPGTGSLALPALGGPGRWALLDAFPRLGHQIGTLPRDERGQVTTSSTSSVQGSSAKLAKASLSCETAWREREPAANPGERRRRGKPHSTTNNTC